MARVFRVPLRRQLRGIYLPQVLPYFRSAASLALGLCWKAGAAAEVIGLPEGTIGEGLYTAKVYFQTPDLFAWTAVIVAVSAAFEKLFLAAVDRLAGEVGA
jgi:NitT/TauT family transport system permease protein